MEGGPLFLHKALTSSFAEVHPGSTVQKDSTDSDLVGSEGGRGGAEVEELDGITLEEWREVQPVLFVFDYVMIQEEEQQLLEVEPFHVLVLSYADVKTAE